MSLVSNENYINIQGWMINELKLSGNSLLVYAIIYGFSQDDGSVFSGSLQYLADWCNATKQGIQKNLKELLDRGLIQKQEYIKNNQKFCEYSCIPYNKVVYPMQQSCTNNIEHTIGKKISNNKLLDIEKPEKPKKKKNQYQSCSDYIMQYTNNIILQDTLDRFLRCLLEKKNKDPNFKFWTNQWPSIVNELDNLAASTDEAIKIVNQSIQCNWNRFYPLKTNKRSAKSDPSERNVVSDKKDEAELQLSDTVY